MSRNRQNFKKAALMLSAAAVCYSAGAFAQTAQSAASPEPTAAGDEIVVTGIRASLRNAQDLKKNADSVVEAVTFEDLGKFTDTNIADALQRIPGVQLEKNDSTIGGDRASIRGLGPTFVTVTANGRTPLTGGSEGVAQIRQVNFDVFPTETIGGILVYKTPTAELPETGLGGGIEIQTLKPLDYKSKFGGSFFGSISARLDYDELAKDASPRISGVLGGKLAGDTIGFYVSGLWTKQEIRSSELFARFGRYDLQFDDNGDGLADRTEQNVLAPSRVAVQLIQGETERKAFAGGVQWRPSDNFEILLDYSYSQYTNKQDRPLGDLIFDRGAQSIYNGISGANGFTVRNGQLLAFDTSGLTFAGGTPGAVVWDSQPLLFNHDQKSQIFGAKAIWSGDTWKLAGDASLSKGTYLRELRLFFGGSPPSTTSFIWDGRPTVPTAEGLTNTRPLPGSEFFGSFNNIYDNDSENYAFRLDFEKEVTPSFTLKVGARHQQYDINVGAVSDFHAAPDAGVGFTSAIAAQLTTTLFQPGNADLLPGFGFGVNLPNMSFLAANQLIPRLTTGAFRDASTSFVDPSIQFKAVEKTTAFYVQGNFDGSILGMPVNGNVGARLVKTDLTSSALSSLRFQRFDRSISSQVSIDTVDRNSYWNFLPSLNLNFEIGSSTNLRIGLSKVLSRPEFDLTAPRNSLTLPDPADPLNDLTQNGFGVAGNTQLKAATASQFDLTLEHYTPNDGALYGSVFYKDIKDFVITIADLDATIPGVPGELFDVTRPVNATTATVFGFEVGLNQPFTFLPSPWDGFGVSANYTFVDSQVEVESGDFVNGLPGTSKHNFNGIIYYEKYGFGARLAYVYRSDYFGAIGGGADRSSQPQFTAASGQLNLNISYDIGDNFQIFAAGANLTKSNRRDYIGDKEFFRTFVQRPRTFSIGARASF